MPSRLGPALLWGALAAVLLLVAIRADRVGFAHLVDDAYISFRYADHWVRGEGLVFNPGARVEGYTNFLWVAAIAASMSVGADPVPAARMLGLFFCLGTVVQTFRLSRHVVGLNAFALLPAALLAANAGFVLWASGGLGTHLFAFLALSGMLQHLRATRPADHARSATWFALASLARPEGALLAAVSAAHLAWRAASDRGHLRGAATLAATYATLLAPYLLFKWIYYGALLPNTFYAKAPIDAAPLAEGSRYVIEFLWTGFGPALPVALVLCLARRRGEAWLSYLLAITLPYLAYVVWIGGDAYPAHRFCVPLVPPLAVLVGAGFREAHALLSGWRPLRVPARATLCLALAFAGTLAHAFSAGEAHSLRIVPAYDEIEGDRIAVAGWMRRELPADISIALNPAGIIPYFTRLRALDMLGLNDAHIARSTPPAQEGVVGHLRHDTRYVLDAAPDLILVGSGALIDGEIGIDEVMPYYRFIAKAIPGDRALLLEERLYEEYRLVAARITPGSYLPLFLSRRSAIDAEGHAGLVAVPFGP